MGVLTPAHINTWEFINPQHKATLPKTNSKFAHLKDWADFCPQKGFSKRSSSKSHHIFRGFFGWMLNFREGFCYNKSSYLKIYLQSSKRNKPVSTHQALELFIFQSSVVFLLLPGGAHHWRVWWSWPQDGWANGGVWAGSASLEICVSNQSGSVVSPKKNLQGLRAHHEGQIQYPPNEVLAISERKGAPEKDSQR